MSNASQKSHTLGPNLPFGAISINDCTADKMCLREWLVLMFYNRDVTTGERLRGDCMRSTSSPAPSFALQSSRIVERENTIFILQEALADLP